MAHKWSEIRHKRQPPAEPVVHKLDVDDMLRERVQSLTATYKIARLTESEEEAVAKLILMLAVAEWKLAK